MQLQGARDPDAQDVSLGPGAHYFEVDDQLQGGYGVVQEVWIESRTIRFRLDDAFAQSCALEGALRLEFAADVPLPKGWVAALRRILGDVPVRREAEG